MEPIKYKVLNTKGKEVGSVELDPKVFGATINKAITYDTIRWQLDKKRTGNHSCLSKGVMKGGNKKPWRQKGTGRARAGSNTSPVWVGGAVAHGPKVNDYETRLSKRARRQALISVLSAKVSSQKLIVIDSLDIESGKTKEMVATLKNIGAHGSAALILPVASKELSGNKQVKATRNISDVETLPVEAVNAYDLLRLEYLVSTVDGVGAIQKMVRERCGEVGK